MLFRVSEAYIKLDNSIRVSTYHAVLVIVVTALLSSRVYTVFGKTAFNCLISNLSNGTK